MESTKGICIKIATCKQQRHYCPSILSQPKSERLFWFSRKKTSILYTWSLCNANNQGSKAMFLESIFSCNCMVWEFYSIDLCSYFARYLWVQYRYPRSEKFYWLSIKNWLIWCIGSPYSTKLQGFYGFFQTYDNCKPKFSKMAKFYILVFLLNLI